MNSFRVLAVIPARAGSVGVPNKNLRLLDGVHLVVHSMRHALETKLVTHVIVSSDSERILEAAAQATAPCQGLTKQIAFSRRPAELATAMAKTDDVLLHELANAANGVWPGFADGPFTFVVLLQPTSPIRGRGLVDLCIERMIRRQDMDSLHTVHEAGHFHWWRGVKGDWQTNSVRRPMRQEMTAEERHYVENGSVYVTRAAYLLEHRERVALGSGKIMVQSIDVADALDIDSEYDLWLAERILEARRFFEGGQSEAVAAI